MVSVTRGELDQQLRALSHPIRREILWMVWETEALAGDLAHRFDVSAPTVSTHLKMLREAGLVTVRREGTRRWYSAHPQAFFALKETIFDRALPAEAIAEVNERLTDASTRAPLVRDAIEISTGAIIPCSTDEAFALWTVAEQMSWCGDDAFSNAVPGGTFGFVADFGIKVRGLYIHVFEPRLLTFSWDFSVSDVPIPPGENQTTLVFSQTRDGTRVEVCQTLYDRALVPFMEAGWTQTMVRLSSNFDGLIIKPAI